MAIFKDGYFSFGGTNLSASCRAIAFEMGAEAQDTTAMGNDDRISAAGLRTYAFELEMNWAAGTTSVDSIFGTTAANSIAFIFKPTTAAVSATNPSYSGTAVRTAYSFGGAAGDQHIANVSLVAGSDLVRSTTG